MQAKAETQRASLVLYKGQWMRKYDVEQLRYIDYVRAHGYVHYFGKWRPKADVRKLRRDARRHMNRLASSSLNTRDRARADLHKMAKKHEMPRLTVLADRVHKDYGGYWRRYHVQHRTISRPQQRHGGRQVFVPRSIRWLQRSGSAPDNSMHRSD